MEPISYIRKTLFLQSQAGFAALVGVSQATISRWESGQLEPTRPEMVRIRDEALKRGIAWEDRLFFEVPPPVVNSPAAAAAGSVSSASDLAAFSATREAAE